MNFNGAQLHLLTNHLPVVGSLFATLVLLSGLLLKNSSVRRTGLALLAFAALTTLPAYFSGEPAEEKIEDLPGVSESLIHDHEEAAEATLVVLALTGVVAAGGLALGRMRRESLESKAQWASLALGVVSAGFLANTAHLGGFIRHPEIRPAGLASSEAGVPHENAKAGEGNEEGDHDE